MAVLMAVGAAGFFLFQNDLANVSTFLPGSTEDSREIQEIVDGVPVLVASYPAEGEIVRESEVEVSVTFDEPIQDFSFLEVMYLDEPLSSQTPVLSSDRKTLKLPVKMTSEGTQQVNYTACTDEKSCYTNILYFTYEK